LISQDEPDPFFDLLMQGSNDETNAKFPIRCANPSPVNINDLLICFEETNRNPKQSLGCQCET
jgi:hypothetical protein